MSVSSHPALASPATSPLVAPPKIPEGPTPYVYVLVRKDLSLAQQIVQAGHACLEAGFAFPRPARPTHLVVLEVADREALDAAARRLSLAGIDYQLFFEPDDALGHTALATRPLGRPAERHRLRRYPLWQAGRTAVGD